MKIVYDTTLTTTDGVELVINKIDKETYSPRFELEFNYGKDLTFRVLLTQEVRNWLSSMNRVAEHNSLRSTMVSTITPDSYTDEEIEICPEEACEIPRFDVQWEHGTPIPVLHETGEVVDDTYILNQFHTLKEVKEQEETESIARAIASQIYEQRESVAEDIEKYKGIGRRLEYFKD